MKQRAAKAKRTGRPPRTDRPEQLHVRIAGALRTWLRRQAALEARYEGDVVTDALTQYRTRTRRRKP